MHGPAWRSNLCEPHARSTKRVVFSRAYINFESHDSVVTFKAAFDGHVFVGSKGNQYRCSVEYAPYQKTPKHTIKKDRKDGTIHSGAHVCQCNRGCECTCCRAWSEDGVGWCSARFAGTPGKLYLNTLRCMSTHAHMLTQVEDQSPHARVRHILTGEEGRSNVAPAHPGLQANSGHR